MTKPATKKKPVKTTKQKKKLPFHEELKGPVAIRHYRFAQKYVELNHNGTQAYIAVYGDEYETTYNKKMPARTAQANASRLLSNAMVQKHVEKITNEALTAAQITTESVLARYKKWAEFDVSEVMEWRRVEILQKNGDSYDPKAYKVVLFAKKMEDIPPEAWECIESVSQGKDGFKITPVSKKGANDMLARYLGLDKKVVEAQGDFVMRFDKDDEAL